MHQYVEMQVRSMLGIRTRAKDRSEVAAGRHPESADEGIRILDRHATFVSEDEVHDVDRVAFGVFARQRPRPVEASGAGETWTRFDPGQLTPR
jgi:hypothetical protein